jgi:CDP-glucose 4,6-dehydratase
VLESCRKTKSVKAIVNVTSDKCYDNTGSFWGYRETDPMGGDDPYSASKGAVELVANSYRTSFFSNEQYGTAHSTLLANVRAGNVIGGGDWAKDRLIPDIMRSTQKKETVIIRNPKSTRPWQHVLEPLSGYLHVGWKLLEKQPEFAENWNFGPSDEASLTVIEVLESIKKHIPELTYEIKENPNDVHEAHLLRLDSSKARLKLKWKNIWGSDTTFEKTAEWYTNYYQDGKTTSVKDLDEYIRDAKLSGVEWAK